MYNGRTRKTTLSTKKIYQEGEKYFFEMETKPTYKFYILGFLEN